MRKWLIICLILLISLSFVSVGFFSDFFRITGNVVVSDGLVGYWNFDNDVNDDSGNKNHGVINGNPQYVSGMMNQALKFDGIDDFVDVPFSLDLNLPDSGGAISLWMNVDESVVLGQGNKLGVLRRNSNTNGLAEGNYDFVLYQGGPTSPHFIGGYLGNTLSNGGVNFILGTNEITNNKWHHVVFMWNSSTISTYYNGTLDTIIPKTKTINYTYDLPLTIGKSEAGYKYQPYFNGVLDEVRIYNRVLSESEILQIYNEAFGAPAVCGDGNCIGETCLTCEQDCGVCATFCGDENCDVDEDCSSCSSDCGTCSNAGCDADNDGYNSNNITCGADDCDDTNPDINPLAQEICDGVDNNCDGQIDEGCGQQSGDIIFEDDFDGHDDWSPTQIFEKIVCRSDQGCATAPSGYAGYRIAGTESCSEANKNTLNINNDNFRGGSGKGLTYWNEPCLSRSSSWGSDGLLDIQLANYSNGYEELYIRFYIKFDPDWRWATIESPMQKFLHVSNYQGITNPYDFFTLEDNKPRFMPGLAKYGTGSADIAVYSLHSLYGGTSFTDTDYFPPTGNYGGTGTDFDDVEWSETPVGQGMIGDGNWHLWEFNLKMNSVDGASDGIARIWIDEVLIHNKTDVIWVNGDDPNNRKWNYVWLGGNNYNLYSGVGEQWYAIDDFVVSTNYIGPDYIIGSTSNPTYQCNDNVDNDGDLLTDLDDPGCSSLTDDNETDDVVISPFHPADLDENDCVNQSEMGDYLELWFAGEPGVTIELVAGAIELWPCDGTPNCIDNDGDGYGVGVDCLGSDCNDNNGNVYQNKSCIYDGNVCINYNSCIAFCPVPPKEGPFGDATCSDGIDNDCDGLIDDTDIDCTRTSVILFQDNFDGHADWSPTQFTASGGGSVECWNNCDTAPEGYSSYRMAGSAYSNVGNNTLNIDSTNARGGSGKAFTFWSEVCDSCGWASDGLLSIELDPVGYEELYVRYYMKFQPDWQWTITRSAEQKFMKISHLDNGNPFSYFQNGNHHPLLNPKLSKWDTGMADIVMNPVYRYTNVYYPDQAIPSHARNANFYFPPTGNYGGTGTDFWDSEWLETPAGQGMIGDGDWHSWEFYVKMNSAEGVEDGVYTFWQDGVLIANETDLAWQDNGATERKLWNSVQLGGNNNNPYAPQSAELEQWYAIDDLVISTEYIGP